MDTHLRRRGVTLASTIALAAAAGVAALLGGTGTASASAHPDLVISQKISGSSASGHTYDTITVKNTGDATASHINLELFTTTSGSFGILYTGSDVCEVMPAPAPYDFASACQVSGTLAPGKSVSTKADLSGKAGDKFTNLATVGEYQGDANVKNNSSTVSSWFGPRADLAVGGTAKTGTTKGHATAVTTLVNHGPNNASAIQETVEIKGGATSVGVSGGGSCQIIPPASGYTLAASCVENTLNAGSSWKLTFDYKGTSGKTITMVTKVSALTVDPVSTNNSMTRTAKLK